MLAQPHTPNISRSLAVGALLAAGLLLYVLVLGGDAAHAAGEGDKIGNNLKDLVSSPLTQVYLVVVAAFGIFMLTRQQYVQLIGFFIAAMVVGIFVLSPETAKAAVTAMGKGLLSGVGGGK